MKSTVVVSLRRNDAVRLAICVIAPMTLAVLTVTASKSAGVLTAVILSLGVLTSLGITQIFVVQPLSSSRAKTQNQLQQTQQELHDERMDREFRERLERALITSDAEAATLRTGLRAVAELLPEAEVSLLLSIPDEPRVGWQIRLVGGSLEQAVPLIHTPYCVALSTGSLATAGSSSALDACDHVHDPLGESSSVCIPLRLGDRTLGSVCAQSAPGEAASSTLLNRAAWAIERTGVRVAEQRLQRGPSGAGPTDPITSLPGAQALRHQLRDLVRTLAPFCVGIISIDEFATIASQHSAAASQDALRIMADVLCTTLRPEDLICRLDGPRFAIVLADCSAPQATAALERARESLALLLVTQENLPFTCSAGLVESHRATSLDQIVQLAESACAQAYSEGGNRVVVATELGASPGPQ